VIFSPPETKKHEYLCPKCHKKLTIGVMHRVEDFADRPEGFFPRDAIPSIHLIPLEEIIAEAMGHRVGTKAVGTEFDSLIEKGGSELRILLDATPEELASFVPAATLEGIIRMRQGKVSIVPATMASMGKSTFSRKKGKRGTERTTETILKKISLSSAWERAWVRGKGFLIVIAGFSDYIFLSDSDTHVENAGEQND